MNVKFNYLCRDEGNYKDWGSVIFYNEDDLDIMDSEQTIREYLDGKDFFIAYELDLPNLGFSQDTSSIMDKNRFYEFDCLELTNELPDDRKYRTFPQFLEVLKNNDFSKISSLS